jgi:hypothetical protein
MNAGTVYLPDCTMADATTTMSAARYDASTCRVTLATGSLPSFLFFTTCLVVTYYNVNGDGSGVIDVQQGPCGPVGSAYSNYGYLMTMSPGPLPGAGAGAGAKISAPARRSK